MNQRLIAFYLTAILLGPILILGLMTRIWALQIWFLGLCGMPLEPRTVLSVLTCMAQTLGLLMGAIFLLDKPDTPLRKWLNEGEKKK